MNIAENIDSILLEKKWSRRKLAQEAGIPPSTLQSAMERNKDYSIVTLQKISEVLNVSILELMGYKSQSDFENYVHGQVRNAEMNIKSTKRLASICNAFKKLNEQGQLKAVEQVQDLAKIPEYQKEENANAPEKDNS